MNDPTLLAKKLYAHVGLISSAETAFEKAALYAATEEIANKFREKEDEFDSYPLEKLENACSDIAAALGYGITNGQDKSQHISSALGDAGTLVTLMEERENTV